MKKQETYYVELADSLHANGHNCAQAVACAFADELKLDHKLLYALSEGFGRGMGNTEGTCGALSGAILVCSMILSGGDPTRVTKLATYDVVGHLYDAFEEKTGSSVCKELQGLESGIPLCSCERCIQEGTRLAYGLLVKNDEGGLHA